MSYLRSKSGHLRIGIIVRIIYIYIYVYGIFYKFSDGFWGEVYSFCAYTTSPIPRPKKLIHIYIHIYEWPGVGEV